MHVYVSEVETHESSLATKKKIARQYVRHGESLYRSGRISKQTFGAIVVSGMCYEMSTRLEEKTMSKIRR